MTKAVISYKPIGVIRSEHVVQDQTPIQPAYASGCKGRVEVFPELAEGLRDLKGFSHIYLVYHFHQSGPTRLVVKPFLILLEIPDDRRIAEAYSEGRLIVEALPE
jgi:tRNA (Thr-GGU) A37 N-methylase